MNEELEREKQIANEAIREQLRQAVEIAELRYENELLRQQLEKKDESL